MTDSERDELHRLVGEYGTECAAAGDTYVHEALVARGAVGAYVAGLLDRQAQALSDANGKAARHEDYARRLARRAMELEQKIVSLERRVDESERDQSSGERPLRNALRELRRHVQLAAIGRLEYGAEKIPSYEAANDLTEVRNSIDAILAAPAAPVTPPGEPPAGGQP